MQKGTLTHRYKASLDSNNWSHPEITVSIGVNIVDPAHTSSGSGYKSVTITIPANSQSGSNTLTLSGTQTFSNWDINSVSPTSYGSGNCTISY